jgi:hopene-associated glycosyltransferase HpnB
VSAALFLALVACLIWAYLLLGRGGFWHTAPEPPPPPQRWPRVVAIVPARDEAETVGRAVSSLLRQEYAGEFLVVLVDDASKDGTSDLARAAADGLALGGKLRVVPAPALEHGWTGKLWALAAGVRAADDSAPELYLFADADIEHHPQNLSRLVARLEGQSCDLVSLMVKLHCESAAEWFLIPAFVFFFAMLYPFSWVCDPGKRTAAAAGGCMLLRRSAYERIGGLESLKGELIDDCALARAVKRGGRIWLELSRQTKSLRRYPRLADIWAMVARTAYAQLKYSPFNLAGTVAGLGLVFLGPVLLLAAGGAASWLALASWAMMSVAYAPMLRFYRLPAWRAPLLPAVALLYLAATVDSARRHWRGKGGEWKGRVSWQSQR